MPESSAPVPVCLHLAVIARWPALAALIALTAVVYLNSLLGPFQFDDYMGVATDGAAQGWAAWWDTLAHRIRPLLKASYVATHQLGGWLGHPTLGHHLGSLAIHLVVVALAWRLALALARSFGMSLDVAQRAALGCAALLALHPLATEAVTYLSGRSVALGTLFALAAALAQVQGHRVAAVIAFAAAMLSRETMIVIPALLMLLEWGRGDAEGAALSIERLRAALRRTAVAWIVAGIALAAILTHRRYGPLLELSSVIGQGRLESPSLLLALEYFATRFFLLAPLSIDPAVQPEHIGGAHRVAASFLVAAAFALAWRFRTSRPWWILALAWMVVTLLPMYLVPVRHDGVSERHFYPALWGIAFAFSCEIATRLRFRVAAASLATGCVVLAAATVIRNADYASEVALWEATSRVPGAKPKAFNNLGVAYLGEGRWDAARSAFERALVLDGGYAKARANLERATAAQRTGDPFAEPEI